MDATIELIKDGPLVVKGVTQFHNSRGEPLKVEETLYLCRCGGSKNKPFCDGTHKKIGFSDDKN
ncbi:MAG: CDGSH iron-sulfur domain-containing protein [Burkholderiales bacterium]|nr:CDGSH iron-sulfur domain-containing protein [Burkholderiales bacterium]